MTKSPSSLETVDRLWPVSLFVAVTVTPGRASALSSTIRPLRSAVVVPEDCVGPMHKEFHEDAMKFLRRLAIATTSALTAHGCLVLTAILATGFSRFTQGVWPAIVMAAVFGLWSALPARVTAR